MKLLLRPFDNFFIKSSAKFRHTAQNMNFPMKNFFSKCDQKKSLMENFIFSIAIGKVLSSLKQDLFHFLKCLDNRVTYLFTLGFVLLNNFFLWR